MAKKAAKSPGKKGSSGKSLVIVESPAKARTISKFLGDGYVIEASIGHVRDLPEGAKQIPAEYKGQKWANLGVNVEETFQPIYVIPPGKAEHVRKLRSLVKTADELYLATDEDREGEAISWHLHEILNPKIPVKRLVFHEITSEAIHEALEHPRDIDENLVRAQEARRIVDRLYGYEVSPLLWRKVRPRLSAGRVQSVAVRMICDRERERMAFRSATYWDLLGTFAEQKKEAAPFEAELASVDGKRIPAAKDFDPANGKIKDGNFLQMDEAAALKMRDRLKKATFKVTNLEDKPYSSKPYPPFTTSTLQQEANRKLSFTAKRTMQVAQSLYENGYITYMRTDSTNLASVAVEAARDLVSSEYGKQYLPSEARTYKTKVKNAQEAHEAIRPAGTSFSLPETLRNELNDEQFRLYDMIWKRTIASQMADSTGRRIMITIEGDGAVFQVSGKTIDFAGYLRAYVEGSDDPAAELADREKVLPPVVLGQTLDCRDLEGKSHTTQPPARFNEATLTKSLEELGIGRPSTYASIIDTILARDYVYKKGNALVPTWTAMAVAKLMGEHLTKLVDYGFTAKMEEDLDAVSRGERGQLDYLQSFYRGNSVSDSPDDIGLKDQITGKVDEIDAREACRTLLGTPEGSDVPVYVRVGKFGPFLEQGERRASIPDSCAPDELTLEAAQGMLTQAAVADEPLGSDPETGRPVFIKVGRFGPYVQMGRPEDEEKPKNASLLKGMKVEDVTLPVALKLLELPRTVGVREEDNEPIVAYNGRFGPYIKAGNDTRSLPAGVSPLEVTYAEALKLLAEPKVQKGRFGAAPREPLKVLGESPVTKQPIKLFEGRYGQYVTDGVTNASLPKGTTLDEATLELALPLLEARAAAGPSTKKKRPAKKAAAASGGKKKPAKKKAKAADDE